MERDLHQPGLPVPPLPPPLAFIPKPSSPRGNYRASRPPSPLATPLQANQPHRRRLSFFQEPARVSLPSPPTPTAFSSFSLIGRYFLPHNGTRLSPLLISSPPFPPALFLPGLIQPARSPASQLEQIWGTTSITLHPARESQYQASPCAPWEERQPSVISGVFSPLQLTHGTAGHFPTAALPSETAEGQR